MVHLQPESDAVSRADAEFQKVYCCPAAYLVVYMAIEFSKVSECGYPTTLFRNPPSHERVSINPLEQAIAPRRIGLRPFSASTCSWLGSLALAQVNPFRRKTEKLYG